MAGNGYPIAIVEAILSQKSNQTVFERSKGIFTTGIRQVLNTDCIKIYEVYKSDNTKTMTIVFNPNKDLKQDLWFMWVISDRQMDIMTRIVPEIYKNINDYNKGVGKNG